MRRSGPACSLSGQKQPEPLYLYVNQSETAFTAGTVAHFAGLCRRRQLLSDAGKRAAPAGGGPGPNRGLGADQGRRSTGGEEGLAAVGEGVLRLRLVGPCDSFRGPPVVEL